VTTTTTTERAVSRMVVNRIAETRGLPAPWPDAAAELPDWLAKADVSSWGVVELGEMRERLMADGDRMTAGVWYTPLKVAEFMARFTLEGQACRCSLPGCALRVMVLDPACGAGVFVVAAARQIATVYARLATGADDPPAWAVQTVLPIVAAECVYGVDTDPVAVDLARAALWLEIGGTRPITWLDQNIIVGDTLAGDCPKPLEDRMGDPDPLIILGNPPYRTARKGTAPWIEARRKPGMEEIEPRPSMDEFRQEGNGRREYVLSNLWTFFWRWALWKAMETRPAGGKVALITPKAWLTSQAFEGMRAHMRRVGDEVWVIDLSPEDTPPPVNTRIFPGVKTPICIGIIAKNAAASVDEQALREAS
jgi:hypothetical protein